MKKLFFLSLFLSGYLMGIAQDTIPNRRTPPGQINTPDQYTLPSQQPTPNQQTAPYQPTTPNQQTTPYQQTVPNQSTIPNQQPTPSQQNVQPSVPQQTYPAQPSVPVQPSAPNQSTYPRDNYQNQSNVPSQQAVPVQPSVPAQSPGNYQPSPSTVPNYNQNNVPQDYQGSGYRQMSDMPRIGNKVVRFTFIASPQVTWMTSGSKFVRDSKSRFGFAYGVEGDIFLASDRYSFLTGFVISSLGGTMQYTTPFRFNGSSQALPENTKVEYYLRYVEIPLAIKLRSKDFSNMRFFAQFGLNTWMNIKAKGSTSDGSFNKEVIGDEVRFFALGLNVGAGVEYDLGDKNSLTGGIVYSGSFNDVTSNSTIGDKTTINSLRIRLGFIF